MKKSCIPFAELVNIGTIRTATINEFGNLTIHYTAKGIKARGTVLIHDWINGIENAEYNDAVIVHPLRTAIGDWNIHVRVDWQTTDDMEISYRDQLISHYMPNTVLHNKLNNCGIETLYEIYVNKELKLVDTENGIVNIMSGNEIFLSIVDVKKEMMINLPLKINIELRDRFNVMLSNNRINWFNWLRESTYHPRNDGCVFKFVNGLSVKMDNGKESISEDGVRIYCETLDGTDDITRHATEEDFLVWLNKYF